MRFESKSLNVFLFLLSCCTYFVGMVTHSDSMVLAAIYLLLVAAVRWDDK